MALIPTALKAKLPKIHAYPVGAGTVSEGLLGVPQYDNLRVWFSRYPKSSLIMNVSYTVPADTSHRLCDPRYLAPRWDIHVYAVPREHNATIKSHLTSTGLIHVRDWLCTDRTETWLQSSHQLSLHYDYELDALIQA
jgi:hypothetical protein